jgi:hypothetical protein
MLQNKTHIKLNKILVLFLLSIISILNSCQSEDNTLNTENQTKNSLNKSFKKSKEDFSGEDLFKSIMFANGEFSSRIPSYEQFIKNQEAIPNSQKKQLESKLNQLIKSIKKDNPTFFTVFKNNIMSSDHILIQESFKLASIEIANHLEIIMPGFNKLKPLVEKDIKNGKFEKEGKLDQKLIDSKVSEYENILQESSISSNEEELAPCSWAVACVYYFALAVHNTAAATINIAAAINVYIWKGYKFWSATDELSSESKLQFEMLVNEIAVAI